MNATRDPGHGFTDPVFDAQASFRTLLDVISEPGKIRRLAPPAFKAPEGLSLAAAVCLLTLTDRDTPVWLKGGKYHPAAYWLAFSFWRGSHRRSGDCRLRGRGRRGRCTQIG